MRHLRTTLGGAALAAALLAPVAPAGGAHAVKGRLRTTLRRGAYDDPGVVLIRGARAAAIRRVWFGDRESPAVAPGEAPGLTVAVPPGEGPGTRVPVRVELEDGTIRRIGRFRYGGPATWDGGVVLEPGIGLLLGPPRNLRVFSTGRGRSLVAWEDPVAGPPDRYAITVRYLEAPPWARRGRYRSRDYVTPPGATSVNIGYAERGVVSVRVRTVRDGVLGDSALGWAVH